jgi:hypothetical protein
MSPPLETVAVPPRSVLEVTTPELAPLLATDSVSPGFSVMLELVVPDIL